MTRWRCLLVVGLAWIATDASAQVPPPPPANFAPHTGQRLPLDASVVDESGAAQPLSALLQGRPIIFVLGYYGCSNLCSVLLESLAAALGRANLVGGRDVDVVVASIDPFDTPDLARRRKATLVSAGAHGIGSGWHFLTANESGIDRLTRAVGFTYAYDTPTRQYAHPAGVVIVTPAGRISSYLFGASFAPNALRNRVSVARAATVAPPSDERWLLCFHYDPRTGRYTPVATTLMRGTGLLVAIALGALIARNVRRSARGQS